MTEEDCRCLRISGHLEAVQWRLYPRVYKPSTGCLSLGDWTNDPHIWLHHVESTDGLLADDDVLLSTDTRYWSIHDVQRYFFGDMHCEKVLFTYQYPNLRMPTELGSYFWRANTALKRPSFPYLKEFQRSFEITLKKMEATEAQMSRLIISDQLINIDRLDHFKRKTFFRILNNIISFQDRLELVSLENLCCKRLEGVRLIQQLACFNADTLKYLFLWRFVLPNENPLLINYSYITGSGRYIPRPETGKCFLRSLGELRNLRVLALEYSHIADGSGSAIISLLPVLKRPHFRLQLICREDQTPGRADAALGVAGFGIPDTAWRRVHIACPDLYLHMAFYTISLQYMLAELKPMRAKANLCKVRLPSRRDTERWQGKANMPSTRWYWLSLGSVGPTFRIRDYDNIRRFLVPSIPLREVHLQFGIDMEIKQRQHSDFSCFIRHVAHFYGNNLVSLSIHQWRCAVFPLRRVIELLPRLVRLHYIGKVEDEVDLKRMLQIVACGVCYKFKQITILIQDEESTRNYWRQTVDSLTSEFADVMKLYNITFCMVIYKI